MTTAIVDGEVIAVDEEAMVGLRRARLRNMLDRHSKRLWSGEEGGVPVPFSHARTWSFDWNPGKRPAQPTMPIRSR